MRLIDIEPFENFAAVLRLSYSDEDGISHTIVTSLSEIPTYGSSSALPEKLHRALLTGKPNASIWSTPKPAKPAPVEVSIDELELSVRSHNCLMRANIRTLSQLLSKTEAELYQIRNMGKTSMQEIKEKLAGLGLKLAEPPAC